MPPKRAAGGSSPPRARGEVAKFMAELRHPRKAEVEELRAIVLGADPRVQEGIKWNAPSFFTTDHFATFRLRPGDTLQIVFHTGARRRTAPVAMQVDDPLGLLRWADKDRCIATFSDMAAIRGQKQALVDIVRQWLGQL